MIVMFPRAIDDNQIVGVDFGQDLVLINRLSDHEDRKTRKPGRRFLGRLGCNAGCAAIGHRLRGNHLCRARRYLRGLWRSGRHPRHYRPRPRRLPRRRHQAADQRALRAGGGGALGLRHPAGRARNAGCDNSSAARRPGADDRRVADDIWLRRSGRADQVHALPRGQRLPFRRRPDHHWQPGAQVPRRTHERNPLACAYGAGHVAVAKRRRRHRHRRRDGAGAAGDQGSAGRHPGAAGGNRKLFRLVA